MGRITYLAGKLLKKYAKVIAKVCKNVVLLDKKNSYRKVEKKADKEGEMKLLPPVKIWGGNAGEDLRDSLVVDTSSANVFLYEVKKDEVRILPHGGIKIDNEVLDLDFGNASYLKTCFIKDKRPLLKVENCILLWSHEWGGYYDFLLFIFAKLLRIKSAIGEHEFQKCVIVYPLLGKHFEIELLSYSGISGSQLVDSRQFNVKAKTYYLGNNDSFFYQNKEDIYSLRKTLASHKNDSNVTDRLIYISRAGRRKVINEHAVIEILEGFGFEIIKDTHRSVAEQIALYRKARIIIGPHGASFTNILWCKPETVLIEFFSGNYYPPYFRYLANTLELNYYSIVESNSKKSDHSKLNEDIYIDLKTLTEVLNYVIKKHQPTNLKEI